MAQGIYRPRLYRGTMNRDRFRFFATSHHESDLLTGVPHRSYRPEMEAAALDELVCLRRLLEHHAAGHPRFLDSHEPLDLQEGLQEELRTMYLCAQETGTGPMSSVAGLFSDRAGKRLEEQFHLEEVVVENGGDLYIRNAEPLVSVIHAGRSPLSDRVGFLVPPGSWGVCTSSGTIGHSFSYGKADAVTVIAADAPLADAWATALCNRVSSPGDIEPLLEEVSGIPSILGCAVIVGDRIGIRGEFEVKLINDAP